MSMLGFNTEPLPETRRALGAPTASDVTAPRRTSIRSDMDIGEGQKVHGLFHIAAPHRLPAPMAHPPPMPYRRNASGPCPFCQGHLLPVLDGIGLNFVWLALFTPILDTGWLESFVCFALENLQAVFFDQSSAGLCLQPACYTFYSLFPI